MTAGTGRVRVTLERPPDRMLPDRLRVFVRRALLAARTPLLLASGLLRRRVPAPPSPARVSRILVVRTDRLGDMALTTPALLDLRDHFRRATITVLAPAGPLALLENHPAVDRRVVLGRGGFPGELVGGFDLAIDFTPDENLRGALLVARSRAPFRTGFAAAGRQALFTMRAPRADRGRHLVDLHRDLLASLGVTPRDQGGPSLFVSQDERGAAQSRLAALGAASPRVVVHPGGHYSSQRWQPERFAEVISLLTERTGAACIVLHGPGEETLAARVCAASPDALPAGPLQVRDLLALIACCEIFLGNNSGPLHLAAALGVPTVSVIGPTDPARFSPRGPADRVIRHEVSCAPCGRGRCWHHTCLRTIEPEEVVGEMEAAVRSLLAREEAQ